MQGHVVQIDKKGTRVLKWLFLLASIFVTSLFEFSSNDIVINIMGMVLLCLCALILCKFNPFHPYFWFSCFLTLYSISYPILFFLQFSEFVQYGYSPLLMRYQWTALAVFLFVFTPVLKSWQDSSAASHQKKIRCNFLFNKANKVFLYILEIGLLLISIKMASSGYTSKKEIQAAGDIFFSIGERVAMFLAIDFAFYFASRLAHGTKVKKLLFDTVPCIAVILTFVLFTGDRSSLFRIIFYIGLLLFAFGGLKPRHLIILIPLMVVVLAASNVFRYILMRQSSSLVLFSDPRSFVYDFLTSDFHCAGRNLQILLNDSHNTEGKYGFSLLFSDFLFVFFRNIGLFSSSTWFNQTYFSGTIYGQAFTLVGEGFIMGGVAGVIVLFAVISLIVKFLFSKSTKNIYYLILYIVASAGICFAFREMFMSVLSPIVRQCLPVLIVVAFLNQINAGERRCGQTKELEANQL